MYQIRSYGLQLAAYEIMLHAQIFSYLVKETCHWHYAVTNRKGKYIVGNLPNEFLGAW